MPDTAENLGILGICSLTQASVRIMKQMNKR